MTWIMSRIMSRIMSARRGAALPAAPRAERGTARGAGGRAAWLGGVAAVLGASGGCGPSTDGAATTTQRLEVDCVGLAQSYSLVGTYAINSVFDSRCRGLVSDTIYDPAVPFQQGGVGAPNSATLLLDHAGRSWVLRSGGIRLTQLETGLAAGTYSGEAVDTATGDTAEVSGRIDWCDYHARQDCPSGPALGLTHAVSFLDPQQVGADAGTFATACRALIDRSEGALLVELELGIFRGMNLGILPKYCDRTYAPPPNRFVFRAPGVQAPGTYGPVAGELVEEREGEAPVFVPGFQHTLPYAYDVDGQGAYNACDTLYAYSSVSYSDAATRCSFTLQDAPGRFTLSCTGAVRREAGPRLLDQPLPVSGAFELAADCDVRYRE
ncbi:MAG: hypothetical protein IT376_02085 [Polyangiaceae bacterium]|nr:hypothetical protein [Polyangiaceae bacterium]